MPSITWQFYTDSGLTIPFSGIQQLVSYSNFSDNPQSFSLYFGSNAVGRTLQTQTSPGTNQITLTPANIATLWSGTTAYTLGNLIQPGTPNGWVYKCTQAGTSSGSTPTFPTSIGSTVTDGGVIWTNYMPYHPATEIQVSLSAPATGATPGASINLGTTLTSGAAGAIHVYIAITNSVANVCDTTGYPQIGLNINAVQETG